MTMTEDTDAARVEDVDYPRSQEEAKHADWWRFHYGGLCPADCDFVYYQRKGWPGVVLGPTAPSLIRWTDTSGADDILCWHPVFSGFQRSHRLAQAAKSDEVRSSGFRCHNCKLVTYTTDTHAPDRCPECRCRDFSAVASAAPAGVREADIWRERWYGSEPQRGSAIVDREGNLIAYFGGDRETHQATTAVVSAHNVAVRSSGDPDATLTARTDGGEAEAVAWCSPGQLANLTDVDKDGGVYLPIRKTERGNFTMPLYATPTTATGGAEREAIFDAAHTFERLRDLTPARANKTTATGFHGAVKAIAECALERMDAALAQPERDAERVRLRAALERIAAMRTSHHLAIDIARAALDTSAAAEVAK